MTPTYRLDRVGFRKHLLQADFMVAEMGVRAHRVQETAEELAHVQTGAYKRRFRTKTLRRGGIHRDRAEGRVVNTDPAALSIEFGHVAKDDTFVEGTYTMTTALDSA